MTTYLKEGQRWPGSEWLKDHPAFLEKTYVLTERWFKAAYPLFKRLNSPRAERLLIWAEQKAKSYLFNCQMCGQCILHSTGMTCPMNCPKNLRNGPCGGVRANGHCEVIPERKCIWVQAWERSQHMPLYGHELQQLQPPVNRQLQNTSAWINMAEGIDQQYPAGWIPLAEVK
ncbi:MAG: methylenetetrahydrofolate reductase C-terminal domain-containing protein [Caldilineaceae bacterium]